MSKKFLLTAIVVIAAMALILAGCSSYTDEKLLQANTTRPDGAVAARSATDKTATPTYTVTYFADGVRYSVQVGQNDDWFVDVPSKLGYTFNGLFSEAEGGTQYVSAEGYSLAPFTDGRNVNLFAQYSLNRINVNFYTADGSQLIGSTQVDAFTRFDSIAPAALPDGTAVTAWSDVKGGEPFTDETVVQDTDFYVCECSYRVTLRDGLGEVQTLYVPNGDAFSLPNPAHNGYSLVCWQDEAGNEYAPGQEVTPVGSMNFVAKWDGNEYTVYLNAAEGDLAATSAAVRFGDEFVLPMPTRLGYIFGGWYVDGTRITDGKGRGLSRWSYTAAQLATARWLAQSATFADSTSYVITDSGRANQHKDTVELSKLLGAPLADYAAIGCKNVKMRFSVEIAEINDGYQYVFLSTDTRGKNFSDELVLTKCIQHGVLHTDTDSYCHEFVQSVPIAKLADTVYILYGAGGVLEDDWLRNGIEVTFTVE